MRETYFHQLGAFALDEIVPVDVTNNPPWWLKGEHKRRMIRHAELAPRRQLLEEFIAQRTARKRQGYSDVAAHNQAFEDVDYRARFDAQIAGDATAMAALHELSQADEAQEVVLVCYCGPGKACHRYLLLELAARHFGANVDPSP